jgi:hypothetical protein
MMVRFFLGFFFPIILFFGLFISQSLAVPKHAKGLMEILITVDLGNGKKGVGVLSTKIGEENQTLLAVLLPGYPAVVRPIVENNVLIRSDLRRNFLIRARRHLADDAIATLVVDCPSEIGPVCEIDYQASKKRERDVQKLIAESKKHLPTVQKVWLVGTSMGTVSSSFMPIHNMTAYKGAIHTASISEPYERNGLYDDLLGFDYKKSGIPQFFIHHKDDPCELTTYSGVKEITDKFDAPLVTVIGGSRFKGGDCGAFSQHGFRGMEKKVMNNIGMIMKTGKANNLQIY